MPTREAKTSIGPFEKRKGLLYLGDIHFGSFTSILAVPRHVRLAPESDRRADVLACRLRAKKRHTRRSKQHHYSITSSARASNVGGTSMPSARAVLRLIVKTYLVGCSTGISAGLPPRRIRPAKPPSSR